MYTCTQTWQARYTHYILQVLLSQRFGSIIFLWTHLLYLGIRIISEENQVDFYSLLPHLCPLKKTQVASSFDYLLQFNESSPIREKNGITLKAKLYLRPLEMYLP